MSEYDGWRCELVAGHLGVCKAFVGEIDQIQWVGDRLGAEQATHGDLVVVGSAPVAFRSAVHCQTCGDYKTMCICQSAKDDAVKIFGAEVANAGPEVDPALELRPDATNFPSDGQWVIHTLMRSDVSST